LDLKTDRDGRIVSQDTEYLTQAFRILSGGLFCCAGCRMMATKEDGETVAIIGLGKVGTALGFLLRSAGYRIVAVAGRSRKSLNSGLSYTGGQAYTNNPDAARRADCIFITTGDDSIADVCSEISEEAALEPGKKVIHMSGAGGLDLLESARRKGAHVACIHPLQSFPDSENAIKNIPGSTFGITAVAEIKDWCIQLVKDLGGVPFLVSEADKPLYHAAACMASNYLVTLMHMILETYRSVGLTHDEAIKAFRPLVTATLNNIETTGPMKALTGPIARGDAGTVRKHLSALKEKRIEFLPAYCALGLLTVDLGILKETLSADNAEKIKKLLGGDEKNGKPKSD
jgi:predicted short-subunit dehydrogenase-like oxidoreductase (DUF2520 family)